MPLIALIVVAVLLVAILVTLIVGLRNRPAPRRTNHASREETGTPSSSTTSINPRHNRSPSRRSSRQARRFLLPRKYGKNRPKRPKSSIPTPSIPPTCNPGKILFWPISARHGVRAGYRHGARGNTSIPTKECRYKPCQIRKSPGVKTEASVSLPRPPAARTRRFA